jgi:hypothetical protein
VLLEAVLLFAAARVELTKRSAQRSAGGHGNIGGKESGTAEAVRPSKRGEFG